MSLIDTILGRPLASNEAGEQRIEPAADVPTFGLDALSSAAYGSEAAPTVLLPLGAVGLTFILPITVASLFYSPSSTSVTGKPSRRIRTAEGSYTSAMGFKSSQSGPR
jgi:hypothetical protein